MESYYNHDVLFGSDYYIHAHIDHIGKMQKDSAQTPTELYNTFSKEKQNAKKAVKRRYKTLFTQSVDKDSLKVLDAGIQYGSDEFFSTINDQIRKDFQENLRTEKISKILSKEQGIFQQEGSLARLQEALKNNIDHFEEIDNIITAIEESIKIIGGPYAKGLAMTLAAQKNKGSLQEYGEGLTQWVNNAQTEIEQKRASISRTQILQILKYVAPLGKALARGKTNSDKELTAKGLKTMVENTIFSTGFGEAVALEVNTHASKGLSTALKDLETTGTNQVKITQTDIQGNRIKETGQAASGKADLKFKNYTLHLETGEEIKLEIGISNKFYKSGTTYKGDNGEHVQGSFSSGNGLTLDRALAQTFNKYNRYLAYNMYAWENNSNGALAPAIHALQDAMLTRNIIDLFGSRGENDFAQFMLLNGELVSIWDMIQYTTQNNVGLTVSELQKTDSSQGIVMSLGENRKNFGKFLNLTRDDRLSKTNAAIREAKIIAHVHPDILYKALKK